MQKFNWLDTELDAELALELDTELATLEDDQEFLEQFYGVSLLLDAVANANEEWESLAS